MLRLFRQNKRVVPHEEGPKFVISGERESTPPRSQSPTNAIVTNVKQIIKIKEDISTRVDAQKSCTSPNKLSNFELKKVIGKGSYGKVVLVKSTRTKDEDVYYAMKVINKARLGGSKGFKSVINERSVMMELDFHYIAKLIMSFQTEQKLFMVLELCSGGTLRFHMTNRRVFHENMECLVFYVAEIALALKYLNDRCIIFRDLKAENILLDANGHAKLSDFGMVKTDVPSWMDGGTTVCGTPNTMAPEVFVNTFYGYSCDWWSLGVIAYEMYAQRFPFYGRTKDDLITCIIEERVRVLRSWPVVYRNFLSEIMMKDPERRLGARGCGKEVLSHALFTDSPYAIDLDKLSKGMLPAPIKPQSFDSSQVDNAGVTGADLRASSMSAPSEMMDGERNTLEVEAIPNDPNRDILSCLNVDEEDLVKSLGGDRAKLTNFDSIRKSDTPLPDFVRAKIQTGVVVADDFDTTKALQPLLPPPMLKVEGFTYDAIVSEHGSKSFDKKFRTANDTDGALLRTDRA